MATSTNETYYMRAQFHDINTSYDYDKKIEKTRQTMQRLQDPCSSLREMNTLIASLKLSFPTYKSRPCIEGYCWSNVVPWGLMIPHHSRINRRIEALTSEVNMLHQPACDRYNAEKDRHEDQQFQLKLLQKELDAKSKATKTSEETIRRTEKHEGLF